MVQELFSSAPERWSEICDFPGYSISDWGRVRNDRTGSYVTSTRNTRDIVQVGLMQDGRQRKRSLSVLVATSYVHRVQSQEAFDTPIHLNGDRTDHHYLNLLWRPLWFARKYHRQFHDGHPTYDEPIEDVETHELYKDSMHASTTHGVLDFEIYTGMMNNTYVWPTGQIFRKALRS